MKQTRRWVSSLEYRNKKKLMDALSHEDAGLVYDSRLRDAKDLRLRLCLKTDYFRHKLMRAGTPLYHHDTLNLTDAHWIYPRSTSPSEITASILKTDVQESPPGPLHTFQHSPPLSKHNHPKTKSWRTRSISSPLRDRKQ